MVVLSFSVVELLGLQAAPRRLFELDKAEVDGALLSPALDHVVMVLGGDYFLLVLAAGGIAEGAGRALADDALHKVVVDWHILALLLLFLLLPLKDPALGFAFISDVGWRANASVLHELVDVLVDLISLCADLSRIEDGAFVLLVFVGEGEI